MAVTVEQLVPGGALIGENPLWSAREACLYWVDIEGRAVHRYDPGRAENETVAMATRPGSLAMTERPGHLLVATEHEVVWLDFTTGVVTPWRGVEAAGTGNRLNDGRTDPSGRFWVGSMFEDAEAGQSTGYLHRIDPDGSVHTKRGGIGISNGLAFSLDGRTLYHADSFERTVWAYRYDPETGRAHDRAVFIELGDLAGFPDGACVDVDGCYWMAAVHGWSLHRFTPDGRHDRTIAMPVARPTMPAFGGPDLDVLYVTSLSDAGPVDTDDAEAGALFALDVGTGGRSDMPFGEPTGA